jgi:hypothetical protein
MTTNLSLSENKRGNPFWALINGRGNQERRNRHGKEENVVGNGGWVVLFDVCCCFG